MKDRTLLVSRWQTPDGTVLESRHRHDYVSHDDADGMTYSIDGGTSYIKIGGDPRKLKNLCVYDNELHSVLREQLKWGTRGVNGDKPIEYIRICDMTDCHLLKITDLDYIDPRYKGVMENELEYRFFAH
jgi:hypothetical protein